MSKAVPQARTIALARLTEEHPIANLCAPVRVYLSKFLGYGPSRFRMLHCFHSLLFPNAKMDIAGE
jgi:hypothetical protein